jgi:subtilisin family serine protease
VDFPLTARCRSFRDVRWLIAPSSGGRITLRFESIRTEQNYDFVDVYEGGSASGRQLGSFSGRSASSRPLQADGSMTVVFRSDSSVEDDGFRAVYTTSVVANTAPPTGVPMAIAPPDENADPLDFSVLTVDPTLPPVFGTAAGRPCESQVCALSTPTIKKKRVPNARREKVVPNSFVIKFKDSFSPADVGSFCASANKPGRCKKQFRAAFKGTAIEITPTKLQRLRRQFSDILEYVEVDQVVSVSYSWGIDRIDQRSLPLDSQYNPAQTGAGSTVYVVDTGVRITHSEFGGRASYGFSAFGGDASDGNGHGTHCAGTVAGVSYGVARQASIVSVKVLDDNGYGTWSGVIEGLDWVKTNTVGRSVVSMSLGGGYSYSMNYVIQQLTEAGVPVAVAAGNDNSDAANYSPASEPTAFTVGATMSSDYRAYYSNYGSLLDIFAPGSSITSAGISGDSSAATMSGTSMACPHVAGVMALYYQLSPSASVSQMYSAITQAATSGVVQDTQGSPNLLLSSDFGNASPSPTTATTPTPSTTPTQWPTYPITLPPTTDSPSPTSSPTAWPTLLPTRFPSNDPSGGPSFAPSPAPTLFPTTLRPSQSPTIGPSAPIWTGIPTSIPTIPIWTPTPTHTPTRQPTSSGSPTQQPTTAPSTLRPIGRKSCEELRWSFKVNSGRFFRVCGESNVPQCFRDQTWEDAKSICEAQGARLCTVDELEADVTRGTGCSWDASSVWSSSPCSGGYYTTAGSSQYRRQSPRTCHEVVESSMFGTAHWRRQRKQTVRCCADSTTRPEPTRQPTRAPTVAVTRRPSRAPTKQPTRTPVRPTSSPTRRATRAPTKRPSRSPTRAPTRRPTNSRRPTHAPTRQPSAASGGRSRLTCGQLGWWSSSQMVKLSRMNDDLLPHNCRHFQA